MPVAKVVSIDGANLIEDVSQDAAATRDPRLFVQELEECFPGYTDFEFLYAANCLYAFRCVVRDSGQRLFVKASLDNSHVAATHKIRHEWRCQALVPDLVGIKRAFSIESCNNEQGVALIYNDEGEMTAFSHFARPPIKLDFHEYVADRSITVGEPIDLDRFLVFAIDVVMLLGKLQARGLAHGQINPQSLGVSRDGRAMLFDLSCATLIEREEPQQAIIASRQLPFMSPESSGRINRAVEYRSDYYSLGVSFYYLLTGVLPFTAATALELMYKHIAEQAKPMIQVQPTLPKALSDVVNMLMAKSPEDRYQSADGITSDLRVLHSHLLDGTLYDLDDFTPGATDDASRFRLPQRLVGRSDDIEQIRSTFASVRKNGGCRVTIVRGPSGSGKSSLVREIHSMVLEAKSFYTMGKFDQYKRGVPFFSLIQAGADLVRQVLGEDEDVLMQWRIRIQEALGDNIGVMLDVLPELEKMFGADFEAPALMQLGPAERETRFTDTFVEFILCFARKGLPLVVSIDDIQWASVSELNLIASLAGTACQKKRHSLHLFVAYRDNEVLEDHHTHVMLKAMRSSDVVIDVVEIKGLTVQHVRELVLGTLRYPLTSDIPEIDTLARLIVAKTEGNAFFVTRLLKSFYDRRYFFYDFERFRWAFNLPEILKDDLPVNVIDLLAAQLQQMTPEARECLSLAACLGTNRFTLSLVATVAQKPSGDVGRHMWEALRTGLILPIGSLAHMPGQDEGQRPGHQEISVFSDNSDSGETMYRFLHDRVQQAAYQLVDDADRPRIHLTIGWRLHDKFAVNECVDDFIFEIVDQINRGAELIDNPLRRKQLVELNVTAGKKALQSTAFESALVYLGIAQQYAPAEWWDTKFDHMLEISLCYNDAVYANRNYEEAIANLDELKKRTCTPMQMGEISLKQITVYMGLDDLPAALNVGVAALALFDFHIPMNGKEAEAEMVKLRPKLNLSTKQIEGLVDLPICHDPRILLIQSLASTVLLPIYLLRSELLEILCARALLLTLKHGLTQTGAYPICMYGVTTYVTDWKEEVRERAYHYGHVAVKIADLTAASSGLVPTTAAVLKVFASHLCYWSQPTRDCLVYFNSAISTGVRTFNIEYSCYSYVESCTYAFWAGEPLQSVVARAKSYLPWIKRSNSKQSIWYMTIQLQAYVNFMSEGPVDQFSIDGDYFSVALELDQVHEMGAHPQLCVYYEYKLLVAVYFGYPLDICLEMSDNLAKYAPGTQGTAYIGKWSMLLCWALVKYYSQLTPEQCATFDLHLGRLRNWAAACPTTWQHVILFIEGKILTFEGRELDAYEKFEDAYEFATTNGNVLEAAFIAERAAVWLLEKNKRMARRFLLNAYDCYRVFGWVAKLRHLEMLYPDVLDDLPSLADRSLDHIVPFRPVNMKLDRDGTLSKVVVDNVQPARPQRPSYNRQTSTQTALDRADSLSDLTADNLNNHSMQTGPSIESVTSAVEHARYRTDTAMGRRISDNSVLSPEAASSPDGLSVTRAHPPPISRLSTLGTQSTRMSSSNDMSSEDGPRSSLAGSALDFDLEVALRASVLISDVLQVSDVLQRLVETVLTNAGADYGVLLLVDKGVPYIEATGRNGKVDIVQHQPLAMHTDLVPASTVNYVLRMRESTVLGDTASIQKKFGNDPYFRGKRLKSLMCMPVSNTLKLVGVLYLENAVTAQAFGVRRVELLNFLCTQAAIAIEKARLYADLEVAKNEAQASNRMKSEFLSSVTHELRSPFNAVLGMSSFLLETKLTAMQADYVETIQHSSRELLRVIEDILTFGKLDYGQFELHKESFSLREVIESAMQVSAERAAAKDLELGYFNLHNDFPDVLLNDPTRFRQVCVNLLSNSIKFTEKGSVTVTSQATLLRRPEGKEGLGTYRLQISVKDTGIGIALADQAKLFKLFSQIDSSLSRKFAGTGLGLAISEKLVRLMGGKIWVESEADVGSTFHFTILTEVKDRERPPPHPLRATLTGKLVIILTESDVVIDALRSTLDWLGMQVTATKSLSEFDRIIKLYSPGYFAVALIDQDKRHDAPTNAVQVVQKYDIDCRIIRLCKFGAQNELGDETLPFLIKPVRRERLAKVMAEAIAPEIVQDHEELVPRDEKDVELDAVVAMLAQPAAAKKVDLTIISKRHPLRILLAEDNLINSRVAIQHLKRMGYTDVVHAKDGQYALEEEAKREFDVVLMDVQMPRLDGLDATRALRKKYEGEKEKQCPHIIAMTANAMRGDRERCLDAGMHAYCTKPIMPDQLARCLLDAPSRADPA